MRGRGVQCSNVWMLGVHLIREATSIIAQAKIELIETSDPVRSIPEVVMEVAAVRAQATGDSIFDGQFTPKLLIATGH